MRGLWIWNLPGDWWNDCVNCTILTLDFMPIKELLHDICLVWFKKKVHYSFWIFSLPTWFDCQDVKLQYLKDYDYLSNLVSSCCGLIYFCWDMARPLWNLHASRSLTLLFSPFPEQEVTARVFMPLFECPSKRCDTNRRKGNVILQLRASKFLRFQEVCSLLQSSKYIYSLFFHVVLYSSYNCLFTLV